MYPAALAIILDQGDRLAARARDIITVGEDVCPALRAVGRHEDPLLCSSGRTRSTKPSGSYSLGCQRTS